MRFVKYLHKLMKSTRLHKIIKMVGLEEKRKPKTVRLKKMGHQIKDIRRINEVTTTSSTSFVL